MNSTATPTPVAVGQTRFGGDGVTIRVTRQAWDGRFEVEYPVGRTVTSVLSATTIMQLYPDVVAPSQGGPVTR